MLIGYIPVVLYTLPPLKNQASSPDKWPSDTLIKTSHPMLVIPPYAAAFASGIAAFHTIFSQPTLSEPARNGTDDCSVSPRSGYPFLFRHQETSGDSEGGIHCGSFLEKAVEEFSVVGCGDGDRSHCGRGRSGLGRL
ncbi:hypothetical protein VQ056_29325 [Paenibacillus sp. JTLBN-2024]